VDVEEKEFGLIAIGMSVVAKDNNKEGREIVC
jgi:hypothetical protein